jgi:alkanesulfonate monooxygenase SsuD/methylene tetrahydromethanopterin reductase-like flavin-dependent oxidoreductase (luciferase family)
VAVSVEFSDDVDEVSARHARGYAFTFGAMGSRQKNFYNDAFARQGFGDDVAEVQRLWLDGKRDEAAGRVPVEIGFKTNLVGTPALVRERLRLYRDAGVNSLRAAMVGDDLDGRVAALGTLVDLVADVNAEAAQA